MKYLIILLTLVSCTGPQRPSDDYVLVEFASKLEEDYQKLHPEQHTDLKKDSISRDQ